jgi:phenylalanyl-tRNA synthetase beta chain
VKVSYKVLKKYIPDIKSPEEVAQDLIMHTAEVEEIHSQKDDFDLIVYWVIKSVEDHNDADSLKVCMVDGWESELVQIVCGWSNLEVDQGIALAKVGASVLWHGQGDPVVMKKTAIKWIDSYGMICASEEIKLKDEFPAKTETEILDLSHLNTKPGTNLAEALWKDDVVLEIDNKAINHRPDLFSHIGIAREIEAIAWKKLGYMMTRTDFSTLPDLGIINDIPQTVKRYMGLKVSGVQNIDSPDYVKDVLASHGIEPKGILVDITNYSLYLYGQPTHCFDADKVTGSIHIRFAVEWEEFTALNDKSYKLTPSDIVIADEVSVLALGWIIGGKDSAVSDTTTNIIIESAWFDQAVIRRSGKRLGLRTDALNVFEKDLISSMRDTGPSLIIKELEAHLPNMQLVSFTDVYPEPTYAAEIEFNLTHINKLIGKEYSREVALNILDSIFVVLKGDMLEIPLWRKDLTNIADIAEEIARLDGYDKVEMTVPRINLGAITQNPLYIAKREIRNFLVSKWYYEMYTYSFVDESLMQKALGDTERLIPMKNALSEEMTHLRGSLIPNLMQALEDNAREYKNMKLFECEKVFSRDSEDSVSEYYELSGLEQYNDETGLMRPVSWAGYYQIQNSLSDLFSKLGVLKYEFQPPKDTQAFMHGARTANIVVRGKTIGQVWEIHPKVVKNFSLSGRVGFYTLNMDKLSAALYNLIKANDVSNFQENNFDINFVVNKETPGKDIVSAILKSDDLIKKVDLFDIYEDEVRLPGKRSLSFKVYIQSLTETLDDKVKNRLIEEIVKKVGKKGWILR